jgi:hypothetical protein
MRRLVSLTLASVGVLTWLAPANGAEKVLKPASQRFAKEDVEEVPSFQRHILPLMGRLGCNGRACHGSFQGQGGFRLSLFGYDFKADHEALLKGDKPRVDLEDPEGSLMVSKPTLLQPHKGGQRLQPGTWQYNVFVRWIEAGAKSVEESDPKFVRLDVTPTEIVFKKKGQTVQVKAVVHWSDGTVEDVTPLCRYRSNDEAVASINETGLVTALDKGDTHVVAFYDNGVSPIPTMMPVSDKVGPNYPDVPTPTKVDQLVINKLKKVGIVPSELSADFEYLRRVSLDMTGTLPTPEAVEMFLADKSADKRTKKVEELLASPAYAAWWTNKFCDWTGNNRGQLRINGNNQNLAGKASEHWYQWIYKRVADNVPYDQIVAGIAVASSRKPDQSFEDYCAEMSSYYRKENPADFTTRDSMPYFWARQNVTQPEDKALAFAYTFLGVHLQCAQCHKHPFDQWTKDDFDSFKAFFATVRSGQRPEDRKASQEIQDALGIVRDPKQNNNQFQNQVAAAMTDGKVIPWQEVFVTASNPPSRGKTDKGNRKQQTGRVITPKLLGGDEVMTTEYPDPRTALMDWMRDENNAYFSRAIVNRVWATYFGVGIVEPADDQNLANPPSNGELLDYLAQEFVSHKFDLKWLHREIVNSRTYQLSWKTNPTNRLDGRNFSHALIRRLPAELTWDAVRYATASADEMLAMLEKPTEKRAIGVSGADIPRPNQGNTDINYILTTFGKPARATNCDCERSDEPSLLQTVFLRNDRTMLDTVERPGGWLTVIAKLVGEKIDGTPLPTKSEAEAKGKANEKRTADEIARNEKQIRQLQKAGKEEAAAKLQEKVDASKAELADAKVAAEQAAKAEAEANEKKDEAKKLAVHPDAPKYIREVYLRTVSRPPTDEEAQRAYHYLEDSSSNITGLRDLLWAMLNTKEFIVNH